MNFATGSPRKPTDFWRVCKIDHPSRGVASETVLGQASCRPGGRPSSSKPQSRNW